MDPSLRRLSNTELQALRAILGELDPAGRVYLYGSRADDTRRGGDIDIYLQASRQKFTAIFAANDQMAVGALLGLHRHGLVVPRDVSLIAFDDLPMAMYTVPPLSSIHESAYELGCLAASSMLQLLGGRQPTGQVPAPRLLIRESCGPANI